MASRQEKLLTLCFNCGIKTVLDYEVVLRYGHCLLVKESAACPHTYLHVLWLWWMIVVFVKYTCMLQICIKRDVDAKKSWTFPEDSITPLRSTESLCRIASCSASCIVLFTFASSHSSTCLLHPLSLFPCKRPFSNKSPGRWCKNNAES